MNRWLLIGSLAGLLTGATGCLHHHTRGGCNSCGTAGSCSTGSCGHAGCNSCATRGGGILGKLRSKGHACASCGVAGCQGGCGHAVGRAGCVAGPLGWQQGGLDYSSHLQPGVMGHQAAQQLRSQAFTPGPPSAQVGYPYYTVRGPRDFLLDNPPSIGR